MDTPLGQYHFMRLLEDEENREVTAIVLAKKRLEQSRLRRRFFIKTLVKEEIYVGPKRNDTLFPELERESKEICR